MAPIKKTYFLAPTWDYPPDGPITLGNIIADPLDPAGTIISRPESLPSTLYESSKSAVDIFNERNRNGRAGLWVNFLEVIGVRANLGVNWEKVFGDTYTLATLDTMAFELTADDAEYVTERAQDRRVKMLMDTGRRGKSVYMITGIKVARGFSTSLRISQKRGVEGTVGVTGGATPGALGPELGISSQKLNSTSFGASTDVVFAYRVREIYKRTAQDEATINHREHNEGTFLNTYRKSVAPPEITQVVIKNQDTTAEDVRHNDDGDINVAALDVEEDGETCECVFV